jgi:hypothetical protein
MNDLECLIGYHFQSLARREYDWTIAFDGDASAVVGCLWRLVESGRIRVTSDDDGQQFGLSEPVDAAAEVNGRLAGAVVEGAELRQGVLDLVLRFSSGHLLEIIPTSSGYEAWDVRCGSRRFIAVGGGELAIIDN